MSNLVIEGKRKLFGMLEIESSKNALLPIIAASVLSSSPVELKDVPKFTDVINMLEILKCMGATITYNGNNVIIDSSTIYTTTIPQYLACKLRASVVLLGPLLAKFGNGRTFKPGGCNIGARPIDIHLCGFKQLGINVIENEIIDCDAAGFVGGTVNLRFASVGATQNIIMCAVLAHLKTTTIKNCATEPEIVDLCNFINQMGGKIYGAGTDTIVIVGVKKLHGISYKAIADRIIAGTYMLAVANCGGKICLRGYNKQYNKSLIAILVNLGCIVEADGDNIYISSTANLGGNIEKISTGIYPQFATDMQAQTMAVLANCNGTYTITENLFEYRFKHVQELEKMGAQIVVKDNTAIIVGSNHCYKGCHVQAQDLRGGAALIIAGLAATGQTMISGAEYVDRGYEKIEQKLANLGAKIHREE